MNHWIFGLCSLALGVAAVFFSSQVRLLANNVGYAPVQPIAFSHRIHAGELAIDCQYCHFGARNSRHAGVPPASTCMNCHKTVTSGFDVLNVEREAAKEESREPRRIFSAELQKLYDALGLDANLEPAADRQPTPIEWVRVHNLPDFVYFDHRVHVARGVACETCHGPVQSMDRMRQEADLSMGWCIGCHRSRSFSAHQESTEDGGRIADHVSTNCVSCHL